MSTYTQILGVEWCLAHSGIVDECSSSSPNCDFYDESDDEMSGNCRVVILYYNADEAVIS